MKKTFIEMYHLNLVKGHLVAEINEKQFIVDTGSPVTIFSSSSADTTLWEGASGGVSRHDNLLASISEFTGIELDGLLGMDTLSRINFSISLKDQRLIVSNGNIKGEGELVPLESFSGVPVVKILSEGKVTPTIIDTGAQLSYFPPELVENLEPKGTLKDFHPSFGWFETPVYEKTIEIARKTIAIRGGILPKEMRFLLTTKFILGVQLFNNFDADFLMVGSLLRLRRLDTGSDTDEQ